MNVQEVLSQMGLRALNQEYFEQIAKACENEPMPNIPGIEICEPLFWENQNYAAKYGFYCGIYAGFHQIFADDGSPDGGFEHLVCDSLFRDPGIRRHFAFAKRQQDCHRIEEKLYSQTDEKDLILDAMCIGDDWVYGAALYGFYCGYIAAYDISENIEPIATSSLTAKRLVTEHYLGVH